MNILTFVSLIALGIATSSIAESWTRKPYLMIDEE